MKSRIITFAVILAMGATISCSHKANKAEQEAADSIAHADSIAKLEADSINNDKEVISLIKRMYNNKLYMDKSFLKKYCTDKLIKQMRDNGYDTMELNWSIFASEAQDGSGDKHSIISVTPLGDHWFKYTFYDMGDVYSNKARVVKSGSNFKFDEIKHLDKQNQNYNSIDPADLPMDDEVVADTMP